MSKENITEDNGRTVVVTESQMEYFNGRSIEERMVRECIRKFLGEVRYVDAKSERYGGKVQKNHWTDVYDQEPIKDGDKIRVYHGCSLETACQIALEGTSGRVYHPRSYSYESGMNPLGIFVTTEFDVAKKFGDDNNGMAVLEFTVDASDLESPVWNGSDSYFGQGSNPMPFGGKDERERQKQRYRDAAKNMADDSYVANGKERRISHDHIRNSDKPELARNIFMNNEHQALFMGDLDPNMIKRVWVNERQPNGYVNTSKSYVPYTMREFRKKFGDKEFFSHMDRDGNGVYSRKKTYKVFKPSEDATFEELIDRLCDRRGKDRDRVIRNLEDCGMLGGEPGEYAVSTIQSLLWPKQIKQLYGEKFFDDHFNRFGQ